LPWFAVRVRANFEKTVAMALRGKGYEEFLPLYQMRRRWSDRYRTLELPLFPGYLFCRIDMGHRLPLLVTPGLLGIVSFGGIPLPVDDAELAAVQSIVRSSLPAEPWTALSVGTRVRIQAGPLSGVEGVLQQFDGSCRILVSVTLLQRSVSVKVDRSWVYPHAWEEHPIARFRTASCGPASPQRS
jgi:transcription antitermination factor NusG